MFDNAFADRFEELLRWRRDVRHFQPRPLPEALVPDLLRCASLAPSVGNSQPWRFVRLRTPAVREALAAHVDEQNACAAKRYASRKQRDLYLSLKLHGIREAPEIMAVFCDEQPVAGQGLGMATMPEMLRYSVVMAIHNMWLAARVHDVGNSKAASGAGAMVSRRTAVHRLSLRTVEHSGTRRARLASR